MTSNSTRRNRNKARTLLSIQRHAAMYISDRCDTVSHDIQQKHVTIEQDNIHLSSCLTEHSFLLCTHIMVTQSGS